MEAVGLEPVSEADPLSALLLRRDQRWFKEILGGEDTSKFEGRNDPERKRLKDVLNRGRLNGRFRSRDPAW